MLVLAAFLPEDFREAKYLVLLELIDAPNTQIH